LDKKALIVNGFSYGAAIRGLIEVTPAVVEFLGEPERFALVMFTGGADVSPNLYGDESPKHYCSVNPERDLAEARIFAVARSAGIMMTGICRGIQFLNVMNGGRMMHHINAHAGSSHYCGTTTEPEPISCNSLHHQMVIPPDNAIVTAWASSRLSDVYIGRNDEEEHYEGPEVEAVIYPETKCFGVQWHPEMQQATSTGYQYYFNMVRRALSMDWADFVETYRRKTENVSNA
jgi:gamma-glutamyl-gamma-aminobutyrate hydrolase PuuD